MDVYGREAFDASVAEMVYPMRCLRCQHIHDAAFVTVVQRYSDCSVWRCPNCTALIDDRTEVRGGSAVRVEVPHV